MVCAFGIQVSKSLAYSAWIKIVVEKIILDSQIVTDMESIIKLFDECIETECGVLRIYISKDWIPYEYARRNCIVQDSDSESVIDQEEFDDDVDEESYSWESEGSESELESELESDVQENFENTGNAENAENAGTFETADGQYIYQKDGDSYYFDIDFAQKEQNGLFDRTFCLNNDANIVFGTVGKSLMIYPAIRYRDDVYLKPVFLHTMQTLMELYGSINSYPFSRRPIYITFALCGTD